MKTLLHPKVNMISWLLFLTIGLQACDQVADIQEIDADEEELETLLQSSSNVTDSALSNFSQFETAEFEKVFPSRSVLLPRINRWFTGENRFRGIQGCPNTSRELDDTGNILTITRTFDNCRIRQRVYNGSIVRHIDSTNASEENGFINRNITNEIRLETSHFRLQNWTKTRTGSSNHDINATEDGFDGNSQGSLAVKVTGPRGKLRFEAEVEPSLEYSAHVDSDNEVDQMIVNGKINMTRNIPKRLLELSVSDFVYEPGECLCPIFGTANLNVTDFDGNSIREVSYEILSCGKVLRNGIEQSLSYCQPS